jgi:hypothetical protein
VTDVTALTVVVVGGSLLILVQLLAVLVCWRFGAMRGRAVVEWQDCDRQDRRSDWDDHVDSALEILLTHEAGVVDGATPERWVALEEEFADLDDLAARLGERAS